MLIGRAVAVDHNNLPAFGKGRPEPPQEGVRLVDFMIHMDHEDAVKALLRQARIVDGALLDRDIVQLLARDALPQPVKRAAVNVLRQYAALWPHALGKPDGIISFPCPNVGNRGSQFYAGPVHDKFGLTGFIARRFGGKLGITGFGYGPIGTRKLQRRGWSIADLFRRLTCRKGYR